MGEEEGRKMIKRKLKVMENGQEVNRIRRGQRITDDGLWDIKNFIVKYNEEGETQVNKMVRSRGS